MLVSPTLLAAHSVEKMSNGACRTGKEPDRWRHGAVGELGSFWNGDVQHDVTISLRKKACWLPGRWMVKDPLSMKWLQAILMLSPDGGDGLAVPAVRLEVFVNTDAETSNGELFG
jgi:hypothetical protein